MELIPIGKAELKPGSSKCLNLKGKELALVNVSGKYYCIDNSCTHVGGPLCEGRSGELNESSLTCPWHGSVFDAKTGQVLRGPAVDNIKSYQVVEKNEELFVEM